MGSQTEGKGGTKLNTGTCLLLVSGCGYDQMSQALVIMASPPLCILPLNCKLNQTLPSFSGFCKVYRQSHRTANRLDVALDLLASRNIRQTNLGLSISEIEP